MLAAALGKSSEEFSTAKAKKPPSFEVRTALQLIPMEAMAPLQPNQCAQCRGFGHWKNECPEGRRENKHLLVAELTNIETE